jgi:ABC-type transport system involved in multi-copper enzyme maturation permease subunit
VGPVIRRELRAQARQPFSYWLRTVAVGAMLLATMVFALNRDPAPGTGAELLTYLHGCLFVPILILVPIMTADCLSRERREGTLSLLFLTNLRPFDIVVAKATAHALRAFTFWLATLPALTLPFLIGGAGWEHAVLSVLFNFMALCIALGAGVLASSWSKSWARAVASALVVGAAFWFAFCLVNMAATLTIVFSRTSGLPDRPWQEFFDLDAIRFGIALPVIGVGAIVKDFRLPGMLSKWLLAESAMALMAFLFLCFCLSVAARNLRKHWREEPPSLFAQWLERKFTTPIIAVNLLRRWMRRTLEHNPIGWLEQRTWSGRTLMWVWLAVVTSIYITVFSGLSFTPDVYEALQGAVAWSLALGVAFTAAGSFRRERETGVLELLLVSPTSSGQILSGRVRGLWAQFFPALALLFGIWAFLFTFGERGHSFARLVFYATLLLSLPVIGLYFSLKQRSFFSAMLWTLGIGCALPVLMQVVLAVWLPVGGSDRSFGGQGFAPLWRQSSAQPSLLVVLDYIGYVVRVGRSDPQLFSTSLILASVLQALNAVNYGLRLRRSLARRSFDLHRGPV